MRGLDCVRAVCFAAWSHTSCHSPAQNMDTANKNKHHVLGSSLFVHLNERECCCLAVLNFMFSQMSSLNGCSSLFVSLFCRLRIWIWTLVLLDLKCPPVEGVGNCNEQPAVVFPGASLYGGWLGGVSLNYKGEGRIVTNGTDCSWSTYTQWTTRLLPSENINGTRRVVRDSSGQGWLLRTAQSRRVGGASAC